MLESLHVKNLALIDEAEVEFGEGLNILSGETGAGKSIIIGSVNLALGAKVPKEMLRDNSKNAYVELIFTITNENTKQKLNELLDGGLEDDTIILSRNISASRSVSRVNGEMVSSSRLKEISAFLIDIYGQKENHKSLLSRKEHLDILDEYAKASLGSCSEESQWSDAALAGALLASSGNYKEKTKPSDGTSAYKSPISPGTYRVQLQQAYREYCRLTEEYENANLDTQTRQRELQFLNFEVDEIEQAHLIPGEDEQLEQDYRRFSNGKKILESLNQASEATGGENGSASELVGMALRELNAVSEYDSRIEEMAGQLAEIENLLSDFNHGIVHYIDDEAFDEEAFYETQKRLDEINHLKSKYGDSIEEILDACEEKSKRIAQLTDYDSYLAHLLEQKKAAEKRLADLSEKVSALRKQEAVKLSEAITQALLDLNFLDVRFSIDFEKTDEYTATGTDDVQFMISTNPGEPLRPLDKVASGGELSRIMLALKTVMAETDAIDTLIFDEIDSGISGRTAQMVAQKMNALGRSRQIICITHLPQIAAMADRHFLIEKGVEDDVTHTNIYPLDEEQSTHELARMLGGVEITPTVIESAREMRSLARAMKQEIVEKTSD